MTIYWGKKVTLLVHWWKTRTWVSYILTLLVCFLFSAFYQYMEDRRLHFKASNSNPPPIATHFSPNLVVLDESVQPGWLPPCFLESTRLLATSSCWPSCHVMEGFSWPLCWGYRLGITCLGLEMTDVLSPEPLCYAWDFNFIFFVMFVMYYYSMMCFLVK